MGEIALAERAVIVIDIGKTLAKLTLWDSGGRLIERRTRANPRAPANTFKPLDVAGLEDWIAETLTAFATLANVGAIIPVAHGAAAAIVRGTTLVQAPSDYEAPLAEPIRSAYLSERDPFAMTGSPALPFGLNLGAQLYRQRAARAQIFAGGSQILLWPQYWSWRLSGVASCEATSLGCHTDLWQPATNKPSDLAERMGWADCLPPLRKAADILGPISGEWAERTGLPTDTAVYCGIHDSNAALVAARGFPDIAGDEATIVSTGTWFVAMRTTSDPFDIASLPEDEDCLVNIDAFGRPIPSARWMGGREIESEIGIDTRRVDIKPDQPALLAAVPAIVARNRMLFPTSAPGVGPYPRHRRHWRNEPDDWIERRAAVCLYAAMVTNRSLDLVGARRSILIEGRFAEAEVFVRALASLRPTDAVYTANAHNDVSFGALRLINPALVPDGELVRVEPLATDLTAYHQMWIERVGG